MRYLRCYLRCRQPSANQREVVNKFKVLVRLFENPCSFYSSDPVQLKRLLALQVAPSVALIADR
ncbi:hypothetical protein [Moorena sp. SIO4G3]|uniref:hypothetical protein n=1 Tax=Moorena sp. SIO4G3 TaxID=2607821 RepID=UPI00142A0ED5|nr:hypothetical protein [Moorena sp. SIO4G3]NEO75481.1 hypothetical protein [Moorena sp. SIO4G3]